jgi:hypothetical protein
MFEDRPLLAYLAALVVYVATMCAAYWVLR